MLRQSFDAKMKKIQNKTENLRNSFDQSFYNVNRTLQMLNERTSMKAIAKRFKLEEFFIGKSFSSYGKLHTIYYIRVEFIIENVGLPKEN